MNPGFIIISFFMLLFITMGIGCVHGNFILRRRINLLNKISTSNVSSVAEGLVELKGRAQWKDPLYSPLSGAPCVYHSCSIEMWRKGKEKGPARWVPVYLKQSGELPFYLEDGSGRILIDPKGSSMVIEQLSENIISANELTPEMHKLLDGETSSLVKVARPLIRANVPYRVNEFIVKTGQELYVFGTAAQNPEVEEARRKSKRGFSEVIKKIKKSPELLSRFDANGDGAVDMGEWEAGVGKLRAKYSREAAGVDELVVCKGDEVPVLYISDQGEREFVRLLEKGAFWRLFFAPFLFLGGIVGECAFINKALQYFETSHVSLMEKAAILLGPALLFAVVYLICHLNRDWIKGYMRGTGQKDNLIG